MFIDVECSKCLWKQRLQLKKTVEQTCLLVKDLIVSWGWTTALTRLHPMQKALGLIPELRKDKEVSLNYSVSTEWNPVCSVKDKHLSALDTHFVA